MADLPLGGAIDSPRKLISTVNLQLVASFMPAAKNVASAGTELLRAFHTLHRAVEAYSHTIEELAASAKRATPGAQEIAKELSKMNRVSMDVVRHHERTVSRLAVMVSAANKYSHEEKTKLKQMIAAHANREKELRAEEKRGLRTEDELDEFYVKEARHFCQQQEMRYAFFLNKHRAWFSSYNDLLSFASSLQDDDDDESSSESESSESESESTQSTDSVHSKPPSHNTLSVNNVTKSRSTSHVSFASDQVNAEHTAEETSILTAEEEKAPEPEQEKEQKKEKEQEKEQEQEVEVEEEVVVVQPAIQIAVEKAPVVVAVEQSFVVASAVASPALSRASSMGEIPSPPPSVIGHTSDSVQLVSQKRRSSSVRDAAAAAATPAAAPRHIDAVVSSSVEVAAAPAPTPAPTPLVNPPKTAPVVVAAAAAPVAAQAFGASDYGKTLIVTENFNAKTRDQLTVNEGDRVVLIKSGTRGWVFIKDRVSERTGWIPATFVRSH